MKISDRIKSAMLTMRDDVQANHLRRFFKCAQGEYGEGDRFLGIRVPQTRALVKRYRAEAELSDALLLVESGWHEVRLAGFLLMIEIFIRYRKQKDVDGQQTVVACYMDSISRGNNWDLVDLVAPKILGIWLVDHPEEREVLDRLALREDSLWHQRVAVVTTFALIREGIYDDTFRMARTLLHHPHDLIHKAVGWMMREAGKRGGMPLLIDFLDRYASGMPRTMLRYAIEKFPEPLRRHYLQAGKR
ncbi:MAG: DNA alkylation repair protein [Muribaculaceae bacterium]|nr:DNA alkylation repair protein [Muribaculaceae bacterium]